MNGPIDQHQVGAAVAVKITQHRALTNAFVLKSEFKSRVHEQTCAIAGERKVRVRSDEIEIDKPVVIQVARKNVGDQRVREFLLKRFEVPIADIERDDQSAVPSKRSSSPSPFTSTTRIVDGAEDWAEASDSEIAQQNENTRAMKAIMGVVREDGCDDPKTLRDVGRPSGSGTRSELDGPVPG